MDELLRSFTTNFYTGNMHSDQEYDGEIKSQIESVKKISEGKLIQRTSTGVDPLDVSLRDHNFRNIEILMEL